MFYKRAIIVLILFGAVFFVMHPIFAQEQGLNLKPGDPFCNYLQDLFTFLLSLAAFLSVLMIVIAGIKWIVAAGNTNQITDAKDMLWKAVIGLIIALAAWLILETINKDLVGFGGCATGGGAGTVVSQTERTIQITQTPALSGAQKEVQKEIDEAGLTPGAIGGQETALVIQWVGENLGFYWAHFIINKHLLCLLKALLSRNFYFMNVV